MSEIKRDFSRDPSLMTLTIKEAAQALRISPDAIKRRVRNGDIPFFYLGNLIRIPARDLYNFQESGIKKAQSTRRERSKAWRETRNYQAWCKPRFPSRNAQEINKKTP